MPYWYEVAGVCHKGHDGTASLSTPPQRRHQRRWGHARNRQWWCLLKARVSPTQLASALPVVSPRQVASPARAPSLARAASPARAVSPKRAVSSLRGAGLMRGVGPTGGAGPMRGRWPARGSGPVYGMRDARARTQVVWPAVVARPWHSWAWPRRLGPPLVRLVRLRPGTARTGGGTGTRHLPGSVPAPAPPRCRPRPALVPSRSHSPSPTPLPAPSAPAPGPNRCPVWWRAPR